MIIPNAYGTNSIRPRLKRTWAAFHAPNNTIYLINPKKTLKLHSGSQEKMALIRLLDGSLGIAEIIATVQQEHPQLPAEKILAALSALNQAQVLEDAACVIPGDLSGSAIDRYSRQIDYFSDFETGQRSRYDYQFALKGSTVVLVGLGGIGSWVAYGLAGAGVGTLIGIDGDVLVASDLHDQILYTSQQVGQNKAKAAAETIHAFNPEISFKAISRRIRSATDLEAHIREASMVIGLDDLSTTRMDDWIGSACFRTNTPYLIAHTAAAGPLCIPHQTACHRCRLLAQADITAPQETPFDGGGGQTRDAGADCAQTEVFRGIAGVGLYAMLGGMVVKEAIKQLSGYSQPETYNQVFVIPDPGLNFSDIRYEPVAIHQKCPTCANVR